MGVLGNNESSRERSAPVFAMIFFETQVDDCEAFEVAIVESATRSIGTRNLSPSEWEIDTQVGHNGVATLFECKDHARFFRNPASGLCTEEGCHVELEVHVGLQIETVKHDEGGFRSSRRTNKTVQSCSGGPLPTPDFLWVSIAHSLIASSPRRQPGPEVAASNDKKTCFPVLTWVHCTDIYGLRCQLGSYWGEESAEGL
jgi:hypothetical protein